MTGTRVWLVIFGLLDAILLGRFAHCIGWPRLPAGAPWWFQIVEFMRPVFLTSLALSAFGLALERKWALILSYIQFPYRFVVVLLSFGFLTLIPPLVSVLQGHERVVVLAMVLECGRLAVTVLIHRRLARCPNPQTTNGFSASIRA